jgi:hypothetical protein
LCGEREWDGQKSQPYCRDRDHLSHLVFPFLFIIGHDMPGAAAPYARGKSQSQWKRSRGWEAQSKPTAVHQRMSICRPFPRVAAAQHVLLPWAWPVAKRNDS